MCGDDMSKENAYHGGCRCKEMSRRSGGRCDGDGDGVVGR